jgi:hypothetical protein
VGLAAVRLLKAGVEMLLEGLAVAVEPVFFGLEEVQSVGDDLRGLTIVATIDLTLNPLLGDWIEIEGHGQDYTVLCGYGTQGWI